MKNRIIQLLGGVPRGALHEKPPSLDEMLREHTRQIAEWNRHCNEITADLNEAVRQRDLAMKTAAAYFQRIAACETPNSNGTVRKMARIAREALDN